MISRIRIAALFLSLFGAVLDFTVATLLLQSVSMNGISNMGMDSISPSLDVTVWSLLLYSLGMALLVTGVLGVTQFSNGRMKVFGGAMILYGIIMLVIGVFMLAGITPMMEGVNHSGLAMFLLGFGMIVNGLLMGTRHQMDM
jgi:hypothetical protein